MGQSASREGLVPPNLFLCPDDIIFWQCVLVGFVYTVQAGGRVTVSSAKKRTENVLSRGHKLCDPT